MKRFEGKVVMVTAGAGYIGSAVSERLVSEGAKVIAIDNNDDSGNELLKKIPQGLEFINSDVTVSAEVNKVVENVIQKYGRIDALINHAGRARGLTIEEITDEMLDFTISMNLKSAFYYTRAVVPHMVRQGFGAVTFTSSINALMGGLSESGYAASKAGLASLIQTLTADYSPLGLRFNLVYLGSFPSPKNPVWNKREEDHPGTMANLAGIYPLKRVGKPEDVANLIAFLASDEASWITGAAIPLDGGLSATGGLPGRAWWETLYK